MTQHTASVICFRRLVALVGLLVAAAALVIVSPRAIAQSNTASPAQRQNSASIPKARPKSPEERRVSAAQSKAWREGGLHAAAKIKGSAIRNVPVGFSGRPNGIQDVLAQSVLVVVGRPSTNRAFLTKDGRDILMEHQVPLTAVIKGARAVQEIRVIMRGGRVGFPDGTWAQVNTPGFLWPLPTTEYAWFVQPASAEIYKQLGRDQAKGLLYEPVYGPLGVYSLTTDFVRPSGGSGSPLAAYVLRAKMNRQTFLRWVEEASR